MGPNEMVYIVDDDARAGEALSPLLRGGPGAPKAALCRRSTSRNLHHWAEKPVQGTNADSEWINQRWKHG